MLFNESTHLLAEELLAGFDVSLDLTGHWLDHFDAILIKNIKHVPNSQT